MYAALQARLTDPGGKGDTLLEEVSALEDDVDAFLWDQSGYLSRGAGRGPALAVLEEFLKKEGEKLVQDPLRRALLQHDLWAVYDHLAGERYRQRKQPGGRTLESRLAKVLQRLALSAEQIQALPDNYAAAVAAKSFPADYDPAHPGRPFLPEDLWEVNGPWVLLGDKGGELVTPAHVQFFGGRSTFFAFLRLPGGRKECLDYLDRLNRRGQGEAPQLPPGSQVALARQMLLIDNQGRMSPTRLTETVQVRVFRDTSPGAANDRLAVERAQKFFAFRLGRADLLTGKDGGLHLVGADDVERAFPLYLGNNVGTGRERILGSCAQCHGFVGIASLNSYTRPFVPHRHFPELTASGREAEGDKILAWKRGQFSSGLLQGLLENQRAD